MIVDLSTFVDLEGGTHSIDSNGHLITNGWGIGFPSIYLDINKTYRFVIGYDTGGGPAYFDAYSLLGINVPDYDASNFYDMAYMYSYGSSKNASSTGPGVGTFTMFLGPGIMNFNRALTADFDYEGQVPEHYLLWYFWTNTPTFKVTSISYTEVVLERGDWEPTPEPYESGQFMSDASSQTWETRGQSYREWYQSGDPYAFTHGDIIEVMDEANNWPPVSSEQGYGGGGGDVAGAWWGLSAPEGLGGPWQTQLGSFHNFGLRGFNVSSSYHVPPENQWPEGVVGYEWDDPDQLGGASAATEVTSLRLVPTETVMTRASMDSTTDPTSDPPFTTRIMVAPVTFVPDYSSTSVPAPPPETDLTEVATYNWPGGPYPPATTTELLSASTGPEDIELLPYVNVQDKSAMGMAVLITDPTPIGGEYQASLFGANEIRHGAYISTPKLVATFQPPTWRWIYATEITNSISVRGGDPRREFT